MTFKNIDFKSIDFKLLNDFLIVYDFSSNYGGLNIAQYLKAFPILLRIVYVVQKFSIIFYLNTITLQKNSERQKLFSFFVKFFFTIQYINVKINVKINQCEPT